MIVFRSSLLLLICHILIAAVQSDDSTRPKSIFEIQSEYLNNEEKLWQRIDQVLLDGTQQIDEKTLNDTSNDVLKIHRNIFFENTLESNSYWRSYLLFRIDNFREYLTHINDTLEGNYEYLYIGENQIKYNPSNVELWTRDTMFQRLRESSDALYDLTVFHNDTVFEVIQNEAKCCIRYVNYVISEAQLVREYYANVGKALIRSHAMTQLAYMLKSLSSHHNFHTEATIERKYFLERNAAFRNVIQTMLNAASHDLWKCNPNPYLDSRTYYTSITNFMQGYIDNEINLNGEQNCDGTCSDYKSAQNHQCHSDTMCAHCNFARTKCTGEIFDCNTIDSDGTACLVKKEDEWENRRYNFVTFRNGSMNGHHVLCFKAEKTEIATRSAGLTNECENCFCFCDEPGEKSDRYFSMREVTSDIGANKVVTGIGIQKVNRVIQFEISERELFPFGKVNDTLRRTQIWKNNDMAFLNDGKNGNDYFTLTREHRSINLDTIILPLDKVITGVRFGVTNNRLHLEVRATDFDYDSGKLKNLQQSVWINNNLPNEQRTEIHIENPDSPVRTNNIQERFESDNKFIEFRPTEIKKDLAQLTIPYIETVQLEASEITPLSGVGLYYKGEIGFGGFLAVKLIAHDAHVV